MAGKAKAVKQPGKAVKKQTTKASLGKYAEPRNKTGKGGFGDRPEDRNNHGQRSASTVAFGRSLRELIVQVGEEELTLKDGRKISQIEGVVRAAYRQAIAGDAPARSFIAERVEGKVTQPIGGDEITPLVIKVLSGVSMDDL